MSRIFGAPAAKKAYIESSYRGIELDFQRRVDSASNPIWGGTGAVVAGIGNRIMRPLNMAGSFALGTSDTPQAITEVQIPEDLARTGFGKDLQKAREAMRETADARGVSIEKLFHGDVSGYFRQRRAAAHTEAQEQKVIMPEDTGGNMLTGAVSVAALIGARLAMRSGIHVLTSSPSLVSEATEALGTIVPAASPLAETAGNAVSQGVKTFIG